MCTFCARFSQAPFFSFFFQFRQYTDKHRCGWLLEKCSFALLWRVLYYRAVIQTHFASAAPNHFPVNFYKIYNFFINFFSLFPHLFFYFYHHFSFPFVTFLLFLYFLFLFHFYVNVYLSIPLFLCLAILFLDISISICQWINMSMDMSRCWCVDVLIRWYVDTLICWYVDMLIC